MPSIIGSGREFAVIDDFILTEIEAKRPEWIVFRMGWDGQMLAPAVYADKDHAIVDFRYRVSMLSLKLERIMIGADMGALCGLVFGRNTWLVVDRVSNVVESYEAYEEAKNEYLRRVSCYESRASG